MKPPWFFCCGWWSPWCVLDEFAHRWLFQTKDDSVPRMPGVFGWICDRHEVAITKRYREDS